MVLVRLAADFLPARRTLARWFRARGRRAAVSRALHRLLRRAHRRAAGRGLPHHLHPRARGVDVDVHLRGDGVLGGGRPRAQHAPLGHDGRALAPTGALFTFIALWTGALWGKPTWGTYWVWGARAHLGADPALPLLRLHGAARCDRRSAARRPRGAVLAIVGVVNIPIIYYSVQWWNTLHQGASVSLTARAEDGRHDAHRHADHGARVLDVQHRGLAGPRALHHPGAR